MQSLTQPKAQRFYIFIALILMTMGAANLQGMLTLFLTNTLHVPDNHAYQLYAAYGALIYTTCIIGGFVGGRYMSHERMIALGLFSAGVGLFLTGSHSLVVMKTGLSFFILAAGVVIPNAYALLGELYEPADHDRHSQFTLAYTCMNIGALVGFFIAGSLISSHIDFFKIFKFSGIVLIIGTIILLSCSRQPNHPFKMTEQAKGWAYMLFCVLISYWLLGHAAACNFSMIALGVITIFVVSIAAVRVKNQRKKLFMLLFLITLSIIFWCSYMLQPTFITLFVERNVDRVIAGHAISTTALMGLNPVYMIFLGPSFAWLWLRLHRKEKGIATYQRFYIAIFSLGLGFLSLYIGILNHAPDGKTSVLAIVMFFFFLSVGEMILAPAGYSAIGELVDKKYQSVMLGAWQLIIGVAASLSGMLAQNKGASLTLPVDTNPIYQERFLLVAVILMGIGWVCLLARVWRRT